MDCVTWPILAVVEDEPPAAASNNEGKSLQSALANTNRLIRWLIELKIMILASTNERISYSLWFCFPSLCRFSWPTID